MIRCPVTATLLAVVFPIVAPQAASAQDYPNRAIRMVVPFPPGGSTNVLGRLMGQKLSDRFRRCPGGS